MNIYRSFEEASCIKNAVVTTGSFDGVHAGHQVILNRLKNLAREVNGESTLITFFPHPRKILYPETEGKSLQFIHTQEEKIEALREAGLDNLIIIPFTIDFSKTSSLVFVRDLLLGILHARVIVVGFNHHFGHNREGDYQYLYELSKTKDFKVEEIPMLEIQHETVSSTKIRKALAEGNIQRANAYLNNLYFINGTLYPGNESITKMGFPSYRIRAEENDKLIPPDGVYAVRLKVQNLFYKGMCSIKRKNESSAKKLSDRLSDSFPEESDSPTKIEFEKTNNPEKSFKKISIEFNLFDDVFFGEASHGNLYFHKRVRDFYKFDSLLELINQLNVDRDNVGDMIF
jgi:riboflavin kinase / FMN adenylyltransferase